MGLHTLEICGILQTVLSPGIFFSARIMAEPFPILDILTELQQILTNQNVVIVQAPPGSGKSTVLPLHLLNESWLKDQKIIMLQPRRLAARSVASRLAQQLKEPVGKRIGYRVRFENKVSKDTQLEVITEGILTRMIQQDNSLEGVGLVIFDEFHERSLHADLALALCREIQQVLRDDLKVMIMSATLDGEDLSTRLGNAPIITSEGRQFPVSIQYHPQDQDLPVPQKVAKAIRKALREQSGDVLAFLPGLGEIKRTQQLLEAEETDAKLYPLYGDLSADEQQAALMPDKNGRRKVILATSIAETSLTIEGIKVVVDSGHARVSRFDPRSGLSRLETVSVTQDAADQRAGRAGRLGPGVCYRLWSQGAHQYLAPRRVPEILEADLAPIVLELAQWGVTDMAAFAWLTPPPAGIVNQARDLLEQLDALQDGRILPKGKEMLRLPAHPRIAHLLLEGKATGLEALATDLAALLEEQDPLPRESGADLTLRVESLRKWRAGRSTSADTSRLQRIDRVAQSWRQTLQTKADNDMPNPYDVGKLIAAAYPERIARQGEAKGDLYRLMNGRVARLPSHDPLSHAPWLAVAHLDAGTGEGKIFVAAPVAIEDLKERMHKQESVHWDSRKGILVAQSETRLGQLLVDSTPLQTIPGHLKTGILCDAIRAEGIDILPWTDTHRAWQARVMSLRAWRPEEEWPDVSDQQLLASLEDWLGPYLSGIRKRDDFKKLDLGSFLYGLLPWPLPQRLDELAPITLEVPSGSQIRPQYFDDGSAPVLAVRLQEMFGLLNTPTVNEGRNMVLLHLLSPGYKPVQVTQDLRSFWENTYPHVRKELRVRYQKHSWPEDPWTAEAVRGARRRTS
jgi:ATP-dependent helicase HrpB